MPDKFDVHYHHGWELYEAGKLEEALEEWREASRIAPSNKRGYADLRDALSAVTDVVGSLSVARTALEICPDSAALYYRLGYHLMKQAKEDADTAKLAEAGTAFQKVITLDPGNSCASQSLALVQWHLKQRREAIETLKAATAANPNDAALLILLWKYQGCVWDIAGRIKTIRAMNKLSASPEMQAHYLEISRMWPRIRLVLLIAVGLAGLLAGGIGEVRNSPSRPQTPSPFGRRGLG